MRMCAVIVTTVAAAITAAINNFFCRTVATSHLTHARCVNLISDCGSLCCGTPHSESSAVAAITEVLGACTHH